MLVSSGGAEVKLPLTRQLHRAPNGTPQGNCCRFVQVHTHRTAVGAALDKAAQKVKAAIPGTQAYKSGHGVGDPANPVHRKH